MSILLQGRRRVTSESVNHSFKTCYSVAITRRLRSTRARNDTWFVISRCVWANEYEEGAKKKKKNEPLEEGAREIGKEKLLLQSEVSRER